MFTRHWLYADRGPGWAINSKPEWDYEWTHNDTHLFLLFVWSTANPQSIWTIKTYLKMLSIRSSHLCTNPLEAFSQLQFSSSIKVLMSLNQLVLWWCLVAEWSLLNLPTGVLTKCEYVLLVFSQCHHHVFIQTCQVCIYWLELGLFSNFDMILWIILIFSIIIMKSIFQIAVW